MLLNLRVKFLKEKKINLEVKLAKGGFTQVRNYMRKQKR